LHTPSSLTLAEFQDFEKALSTLVCTSLPVRNLRSPQLAQLGQGLTSPGCYTIVAEKLQVFSRAGVADVAEAPHSVSELLIKWRAGDQEALQVLVPLVYSELGRIAQHHLRQERPEHTLQSTALEHEAYLRQMKPAPVEIENRAHFLAVASRRMRQILVDHARGLSIEETAQFVGVSPTTIKREWASARAWLRREMAKPEEPD
jgi:DNA-directed RNA polymerase specialized sigma24 family protein